MPEFCSTDEAAQLLGCSRAWVGRLVRLGRLDGFALNHRAVAVSRQSVARNIAEYEKSRGVPRKGRPRSVAAKNGARAR